MKTIFIYLLIFSGCAFYPERQHFHWTNPNSNQNKFYLDNSFCRMEASKGAAAQVPYYQGRTWDEIYGPCMESKGYENE